MKKKIILTVLALNYNACLIAGIIGIMLYAAGVNKCKKAGSISLIIYLLVNLLGQIVAMSKNRRFYMNQSISKIILSFIGMVVLMHF